MVAKRTFRSESEGPRLRTECVPRTVGSPQRQSNELMPDAAERCWASILTSFIRMCGIQRLV